MNKAVFLDRDGTINVEKHYLHKVEDFEFIPGTADALKLLQGAGYKLIIITNQSGIARGFYSEKDFLFLNEWMISELKRSGVEIDRVYYCPHLPKAMIKEYRCDCECRKPRLALFKKAVDEFCLNLSECYAIGDKIRDCSICINTDCNGFLIGTNAKQEIIEQVKNGKYRNVKYADQLYDAAIMITEAEK